MHSGVYADVARMEDVLDLYAEAPDPNRPVVSSTRSPIQLIGEGARRSRPSRVSLSATIASTSATELPIVRLPRCPSALAQDKVTTSRTAVDFAACMRDLADLHFPKARASASFSIICPPTPPARSTKHSRLRKHDVCCADWSSSSIPNMPVG